MELLFDSLIDKVFLFVDSAGSVTYVLPKIDIEFLAIVYLVAVTFKFVADTSIIFISSWRNYNGKL